MAIALRGYFPYLLPAKRAVQYSIVFGLLCALNHGFSVLLFYLCGYCLVIYSVAYVISLLTISMLLSNVVFRAIVRKEEKKRILEELRYLAHNEIPYVMIHLIQKSRSRALPKCAQERSEQNGMEQKLCVACYERAPSIKNIPCGHVVLCQECNWSLLKVSIENHSVLICSWCRAGIKEFEGEMRPDFDLIEWADIQAALVALETSKLKCKQNNSNCY